MTNPLKKEKERGLATFGLVLGMAILLFLPFVIYNQGYFIYYGDFNAQQIPFYKLAHAAIREGNIGWSWGTDLGANFIGSYSFYLLGSPFFWLTLPFPTDWLPFMMAPLLVLKIGLAGWTAYAYTRRFLQPRLAQIAGILYAFSGFSIYNIFFNHFHEAIVFFPLMLLGVEQYMKDGKRGLFALSVLLSALSNYYFFIGQAFFIMIYWVIRAMSGEWEKCGRRFFGLWLEALLGTLGAAVLLLPSFFSVIQNSRTDNPVEGWGLLIHGTNQRLYDILHSFFFPPELPARANFFPDANNKWSSMTAWLPVFGCTGAIAYFQSRKHTDWLRRLLIALFFCATIPALNALFQLFNQMYYARWYYMLTLMLVLATMRCFEQDERYPVHWTRAIGWAGGFTAAFTVLIGLVPKSWTPDEETGKLTIGLQKYPARFWLYVFIAVVGLVLTYLLVRLFLDNKRRFMACCTAVCACVSLLFGWYFLAAGKSNSNYPDVYVIEKLLENEDYTLPDDDRFSRTDMHKGMDNQGMYWGQSTIQAFHSIVPGSVMDFYNSVGVSRSVGSRPESKYYALRSLLSVRWLFDYAEQEGDVQLYYKDAEDYFSVDGETKMPDWTYYDTQNGYYIYENDRFIPMGFFYDSYITRSEYDSLDQDERQFALLKALVVEDADADKVPLPHLDVDAVYFDGGDYAVDCAERAATAATDFAVDNAGFTATVTASDTNWVFFSVPYESGWSATVNGKPADIKTVNVGFMAVECPAGETVTVRFDYETPGLRYGAYISAAALVLLLIYWLLAIRHNRKLIKAEVAVPASKPLPPQSVITEAGDKFDLYAIYKPDTDEVDAPANETEGKTE